MTQLAGSAAGSTLDSDPLTKLAAGPQHLHSGAAPLDSSVGGTARGAKDLIQTRFDSDPDMSVATGKDAAKAARRAEKGERKAKVAAEAAAARVQGALHADRPIVQRNTCAHAGACALARLGRAEVLLVGHAHLLPCMDVQPQRPAALHNFSP